jgi:hypothetical protein
VGSRPSERTAANRARDRLRSGGTVKLQANLRGDTVGLLGRRRLSCFGHPHEVSYRFIAQRRARRHGRRELAGPRRSSVQSAGTEEGNGLGSQIRPSGPVGLYPRIREAGARGTRTWSRPPVVAQARQVRQREAREVFDLREGQGHGVRVSIVEVLVKRLPRDRKRDLDPAPPCGGRLRQGGGGPSVVPPAR